MQENEILDGQTALPLRPSGVPEPKVRVVLLAQIGLMILCSVIGMLGYLLICALVGWDPALAINADATEAERWQIRLQLGLTHLFGFLVSGGLTAWIFYRGITHKKTAWLDYLQSRRMPSGVNLLLGILLMAVSLPLVLYSLSLNQQLPLPEYFKEASAQAEEVLRGLLHMENPLELLVNLLIVALLPALGEELVFRGVVQQQLMRRIANPWVAILVSAMVFSAAHFQFEGFIPRMLLGFLLGWLYWQTKNFWIPVAGHFFNNGMQVIGQYLYGKEISTIDLEQDIQVPWQFALISAFMAWAVMRIIRQRTGRIGTDFEKVRES